MLKRYLIAILFFYISIFCFSQDAVFFNVREGVLFRFTGTEREVVIPEELGIIEIAKEAFANRNITSITFPTTLKIIGESAFKNCSRLNNIVINSNILEIRKEAFVSCSSLTNITFQNGVKIIGDSAFSGCGFTRIELPQSIQEIGKRAFGGKIEQIIVNVNNTFYYNTQDGILFEKNSNVLIIYPIGNNYSKYVIPNGTTSIGDYAFYGSKLSEIVFPSSVLSIGEYAFSDNSELSLITLSTNLVSIGGFAFRNCRKLIKADLADSIKTIGSGAFYDCRNLNSLNIPAELTAINNSTFYNCTNISSPIIIPDNVRTIGLRAFERCENIPTVTISPNVISIEGAAFRGCIKLVSISLSRKTKFEFTTFDYEDRLKFID